MKKRIFLTVFATALITVLVSLILLVGVTYRYINEDTRIYRREGTRRF